MPRRDTGSSAPYGYVPLVEVWRGDTVESVHYGAVVAADAEGRVLACAGDPATVTFLRSAAKPFQVLPLIESGAADRFGFNAEEIAVMTGSHGGEDEHLRVVRAILAKIGLGESDLRCGAHDPYHRPTARDLRRRGVDPSSLHHNCSGKHAAMLALAVDLKAGVDDYLDPGHPVQRRIRDVIEAFAGAPHGTARLGMDGCSAPTFALPLASLARMFARLVDPQSAPAGFGPAAGRVVAAMRAHPDMVAGSDRLCTALFRSTRETFVAKIGAEGLYGLGWLREGRAVGLTVKIADGDGARARTAVTLETLARLEALPAGALADLRGRFVEDLKNHRGLRVGHVTPIFRLQGIEAARVVP